jgi:hypothetical protein
MKKEDEIALSETILALNETIERISWLAWFTIALLVLHIVFTIQN